MLIYWNIYKHISDQSLKERKREKGYHWYPVVGRSTGTGQVELVSICEIGYISRGRGWLLSHIVDPDRDQTIVRTIVRPDGGFSVAVVEGGVLVGLRGVSRVGGE
jgi:hypothetical protein